MVQMDYTTNTQVNTVRLGGKPFPLSQGEVQQNDLGQVLDQNRPEHLESCRFLPKKRLQFPQE